jgi:hypothetical protein
MQPTDRLGEMKPCTTSAQQLQASVQVPAPSTSRRKNRSCLCSSNEFLTKRTQRVAKSLIVAVCGALFLWSQNQNFSAVSTQTVGIHTSSATETTFNDGDSTTPDARSTVLLSTSTVATASNATVVKKKVVEGDITTPDARSNVLLSTSAVVITSKTTVEKAKVTEGGIAVLGARSNVPLSTSAVVITSNATKEKIKQPDLILNVPFYVYDELLWFENITLSLHKRGQDVTLLYDVDDIYHAVGYKHSTDMHFARAALSHPMRTLDPAQAKLFVVPILLNVLSSLGFWNGTFCYRPSQPYYNVSNTAISPLCDLQLSQRADEFLTQSKWFQRHQGKDHILVMSHWNALPVPKTSSLRSCHNIGFEDQKFSNANRYSFPDLYVGTPCAATAQKEHDFVMVAKISSSRDFVSRRHICNWMWQRNTNSQQSYKMPICGPGKQCPALARSRFGFHVRGDTYGANRLMDTLLSHTVPIFTMKQQYRILPEWIDWRKVSYFASVANEKAFLSDIETIVSDEPLYQAKHKNVVANVDLFDWTTLVPFDTYLYMLSYKLWPELVGKRGNVTSRYNALKLPHER